MFNNIKASKEGKAGKAPKPPRERRWQLPPMPSWLALGLITVALLAGPAPWRLLDKDGLLWAPRIAAATIAALVLAALVMMVYAIKSQRVSTRVGFAILMAATAGVSWYVYYYDVAVAQPAEAAYAVMVTALVAGLVLWYKREFRRPPRQVPMATATRTYTPVDEVVDGSVVEAEPEAWATTAMTEEDPAQDPNEDLRDRLFAGAGGLNGHDDPSSFFGRQ